MRIKLLAISLVLWAAVASGCASNSNQMPWPNPQSRDRGLDLDSERRWKPPMTAEQKAKMYTKSVAPDPGCANQGSNNMRASGAHFTQGQGC